MRETQSNGDGSKLDWIKSRPKRSLYRETHARLGPVVVKRFHDPGPLGALWDRRRANREARSLRRWKQLGFPVPAPVEIRLREGMRELVLPEIPGGQTLPQALGSAPPPRGLAHRLGTLLAQMDCAGLVQGDLHGGNVLLDRSGDLWLIDPTPEPMFSTRARPDRARWVRLCAGVRELSSPQFRARFLDSYRRAGGPAQVPARPLDLEGEARDWRFQRAKQRDPRWLRESGAVRETPQGWQAKDPPCSAQVPTQASYPDQAQARAAWLRMGRLVEMGLPCATPIELRGKDILFGLPTDGLAVQPQENPTAAGAFFGSFHDRGLTLPDRLPPIWTQCSAGKWLLQPTPLPDWNPNPIPWQHPKAHPVWRTWQKNSDQWHAFVRAFCAQQSAPRPLRQNLAQTLNATCPKGELKGQRDR